jgi:hypothetical protein
MEFPRMCKSVLVCHLPIYLSALCVCMHVDINVSFASARSVGLSFIHIENARVYPS